MRRSSGALLALAAIALAGAAALGAVVVAPHALFLDHGSRSTALHLHNPSQGSEEVTIAFAYGYPVSDSGGRTYIRFVDRPGPEEPSAAAWLRAYPRRLRVEPGATRTVRLLAEPPPDLPDGEYWARLIVHSVPVAGAGTRSVDEGISVGLELQMRTVISVTYRKGSLSTGVRLRRAEAEVRGDSLDARLGLRRTGEAAYLGTLSLALRDSTGTVRLEQVQAVAVYGELDPRITLPVEALERGPYTLEVRLATDRTDIPHERLIAAPAVERTIPVEIR